MADKTKEEAKKWGKEAEQIVKRYLISKGYTVRDENWRPTTSKSEIDLIAQKGDVVAFVEVKARTDKGLDPADAITPDKVRSMVRGANTYLQTMEHDFFYRFDVATVSGNAEEYTLDYLEDAFLPPLMPR